MVAPQNGISNGLGAVFVRGIDLSGRALGGLQIHELHRCGLLIAEDQTTLAELRDLAPAAMGLALPALRSYQQRFNQLPRMGEEIASYFFEFLLPGIHASAGAQWPSKPIDFRIEGHAGARIEVDGNIIPLSDRMGPLPAGRSVTMSFSAFASLVSSFLPEELFLTVLRNNGAAYPPQTYQACAQLQRQDDCILDGCDPNTEGCWLQRLTDPDCVVDICIWQIREGCQLDETCAVESCSNDLCNIDVCSVDNCFGAACYWAACLDDTCGLAACGSDLCGAALCGADLGVLPCPIDGCPVAVG